MKNKDPLIESAQFVKGVGPKKIKILNRLNIQTIEDLLYHFPRRYEDRTHLKTISRLEIGKHETIKAKVLAKGLRKTRKGLSLTEVAFGDKTGKIICVWFNQPYIKDLFKIGDEVFLYGKIDKKRDLQIVNPEYEIISKDTKDIAIHTNRITPIYPLTSGLTQRSLRKIIYNAIERYVPKVKETLPSYIREKYSLLHITAALYNIHFPKSKSLKDKAKKRLIFEEFFKFQLVMAYRKAKIKVGKRGIAFKKRKRLTEKFIRLLPFKLTNSQKKVIREIENDMAKRQVMQRLLQGDVASGKTIVAIYACLLAVENGFQAALMVPTEILAEQHYFTLKNLLVNLDVKVDLLISGMNKKEKVEVKKKIEEMEADIIIGTHTLIQEDVNFKKLGLVIIDEQHKFGVIQREVLKKKGKNPDVLVMTATPIPRTLAYTIYGDLDISVIEKLPPGRKPPKTWWVSEKKRDDAYKFIKKELDKGRQAYIVYPLIEESNALNLRAAKCMYKRLKSEVFSNYQVGLIHGKMAQVERERIMEAFKKGKIDVLVSTIIIEVGIDIPNASIILIEHADRFGLSQLHQLRGRIGRGNFKSYCILVSSSQTETAQKRLSSMAKYTDGFKIAEQDLLLRGPGEFFGTRQHGLPEIRIGDILTDTKLLEIARYEAFDLIKKDPHLKDPKNNLLYDKYISNLERNL